MSELKTFRQIEDPYETPANGGLQSEKGVINKAFQTDDPGKGSNYFADAETGANGDTDRDIDNNNEDDEWEDDDFEPNRWSIAVGKIQDGLTHLATKNSAILKMVALVVVVLLYFAYFIGSLLHRFGDEGSWRLLMGTIIGCLFLVYKLVSLYRNGGQQDQDLAEEETSNCDIRLEKLMSFAARIRLVKILQVGLVIGFIIYVIVDIALDKPRNLISLAGMAFFIVSSYLFSHNPAKVKWRPVFWGVTLQIIFALLILRSWWGRDAFKWLGDRVTEFLAYTDAGAAFVFGNSYMNHFFAFKVLPVVVFFSTIVSMLYYLGAMQGTIKQMGRFLAFCLGTSPTESVNAAGNIFLGQTEAPLMIRPFLKDMTPSEIHAVMTGGFATIAGSVMAAFIINKVPAQHLLSASVMSAPAALAVAKLSYPETKKSRHASKDVYNLAKSPERNLIEAASNGASMSISLVANIAVNLIAFVALLDFVNHTLVWFGDRIGYEGFTFELICSYVFWPLAYIMGVDQEDCRRVGELIGTKTFLNEFIAYGLLSENINNRLALDEYVSNFTNNVTQNLTGTWDWIEGNIYLYDVNRTLLTGVMTDRSVVISTYALCGFSNLSSMGVQLGALGVMAPNRKSDMSRIVFRAMIAGNIACFMTACISGLFYDAGE